MWPHSGTVAIHHLYHTRPPRRFWPMGAGKATCPAVSAPFFVSCRFCLGAISAAQRAPPAGPAGAPTIGNPTLSVHLSLLIIVLFVWAQSLLPSGSRQRAPPVAPPAGPAKPPPVRDTSLSAHLPWLTFFVWAQSLLRRGPRQRSNDWKHNPACQRLC